MVERPLLKFIDHYDSFSHNVVDWLREDFNVESIYYDHPKILDRVIGGDGIVLGPGPKTPADVPSSQELVKRCFGTKPILGICLGHQLIAQSLDLDLVRRTSPSHGTTKRVVVRKKIGPFRGFSPFFNVAEYNSLVVKSGGSYDVIGENDAGEIEAMVFDDRCWGVQFHPESFLSREADRIRKNFLDLFTLD